MRRWLVSKRLLKTNRRPVHTIRRELACKLAPGRLKQCSTLTGMGRVFYGRTDKYETNYKPVYVESQIKAVFVTTALVYPESARRNKRLIILKKRY